MLALPMNVNRMHYSCMALLAVGNFKVIRPHCSGYKLEVDCLLQALDGKCRRDSKRVMVLARAEVRP